MKLLIALLVFIYTSQQVFCLSSLQTVDDEELLQLFRNEKFVVVLFTGKDCELCTKYEDTLLEIRGDLVDTLNAWVVKAVGSQILRLYSPNREPAVVFFRHGIPLLYDGELNDELIMHTFTSNSEPCVRELTDETFEHLTQASSGATTGDWLVMFYSTDCVECQRLQARYEAVCGKLKTRLNVARINKQTVGRVTSRRFGISNVPTFILLRQGKMYTYTSHQYDVSPLALFATSSYKDSRVEAIPMPKSLLDDSIQMMIDLLRECPFILMVILITALLSIVVVILFKVIFAKKSNKKKPSVKGKKSK